MDRIEVETKPRTILGKRVGQLRRRGLTPVNVYGHGIPSTAMQVETRSLVRALARAGKSTLLSLVAEGEEPRTVLVRDIQLDPRTRGLLHVDFYQVKLTERIKVEVPLHFVGEAPAASRGGALVHLLSAVEVECLPQDMPRVIEVDQSGLEEFDQAIYVRDLPLPPKVAMLADQEEMVAKVEPPRVLEEVAAAEAAAAEEKPAAEAQRGEAATE